MTIQIRTSFAKLKGICIFGLFSADQNRNDWIPLCCLKSSILKYANLSFQILCTAGLPMKSSVPS